jgi:hypothetical protein
MTMPRLSRRHAPVQALCAPVRASHTSGRALLARTAAVQACNCLALVWNGHEAKPRQRRFGGRRAHRVAIATEVHMNAQATLGIIHAQELLLVSLIRSMPPDARRRIADEFQQQVEMAEAPHLGERHGQETTDAFKAHIRKLSILLASLS